MFTVGQVRYSAFFLRSVLFHCIFLEVFLVSVFKLVGVRGFMISSCFLVYVGCVLCVIPDTVCALSFICQSH